MAETLYKVHGEAPMEVVVRLNDGAGAHIRTHAYKYDKLISHELVRIQRVKEIQWKALTLTGSAIFAAMIGTVNLLSRLYFRVLESDKVMESERWPLALLFPVVAVVGLLLLLLCCFCCYNGMHSVRGGCARSGIMLRGCCARRCCSGSVGTPPPRAPQRGSAAASDA